LSEVRDPDLNGLQQLQWFETRDINGSRPVLKSEINLIPQSFRLETFSSSYWNQLQNISILSHFSRTFWTMQLLISRIP